MPICLHSCSDLKCISICHFFLELVGPVLFVRCKDVASLFDQMVTDFMGYEMT